MCSNNMKSVFVVKNKISGKASHPTSKVHTFLCETSAFLVKIHGHRGAKGRARALGPLGPGPRGAWRGAQRGASGG